MAPPDEDGSGAAPPEVRPIGGIEPIRPIRPVQAQKPDQPARRSPKRSSKPKTDPFFLDEAANADHVAFRGGVRKATRVEPIIDGKAIFSEMEKAIREANSSILIAFWLFMPDMTLQPAPGSSGKATTWFELLLEAAQRGVRVRVFFNDFDPLFLRGFHTMAWGAYFRMATELAVKSVPIDRFQIVCSNHEAEIPANVMALATMFIKGYGDIEKELAGKSRADREDWFNASPSLWDKMELDPKTGKVAIKDKSKSYPAHPGSHHQKLLIVDGMRAFVGGLNIGFGYLDSREHDMIPGKPWHDAFVKVEGKEILGDLIRNYIGMWNKESVRCRDFLLAAIVARKAMPPPAFRSTDPMDEKMVPAKAADSLPPRIPGQMHRTYTLNAGSMPPKPVLRDILDGYIKAIGQAEEFLYFENQYYRDAAVFDAILNRRKSVKDLQVIIMLPKLIEEAENAKKVSEVDALSKHGAFLQHRIFQKMSAALKGDLGLFMMEKQEKGGKQIYVHSKILIVDDAFVSLGSGNSNPRSYRMDSELDFVWHDGTIARDLRLNLWKEALGDPPGMANWKPSRFLKEWNRIAKANAAGTRDARKGFVLPFENKLEGEEFRIDISLFT